MQPIRSKWVSHQMKRDAWRRVTLKEQGAQRLRLTALTNNDVIPSDLQNIVREEIRLEPKGSLPEYLHNRCVITGRGWSGAGRSRAVVDRWRLSRFVFRHLVDYNKLSGVQLAFWSHSIYEDDDDGPGQQYKKQKKVNHRRSRTKKKLGP